MTRRAAKKLKAEGKLKTYMDPRLVSALGHPMREHILAVLNERIASATDISREIGVPVEDFYHHFEVLEKQGCIERVDWKPRRGAKEIFFRAKTTAHFDDRAWSKMPATVKEDVNVEFFQAIFNEGAAAIEGGTFCARKESHVTWMPETVDELGFIEAMKLLNETLDRATGIRHRSAARLAKSGETGIPITIAMLGFETCPQVGQAG